MEHVRSIYGDRITLCDKMYEVLEGADSLAIMTEWNEFRTPDFEQMSSLLSEKIIFDGRNVYDTEQMKDLGFQYVSIGRPKVRGRK